MINRVVIDNPTPYPVEIGVAGGDGGSLLTLGRVSSGERHAFASVIDQGDRWVVHVLSARTYRRHLLWCAGLMSSAPTG